MNDPQSNAEVEATIFVVDDEPMLLDLAEAVLAGLGCKVQTFSNPELALKAFIVVKPDLVITDYAMGRMTGMDLIKECRRHNPHQKMILISGTVDEAVFAEAMIKPNRFLGKPYQIKEFTDCIRNLIAE